MLRVQTCFHDHYLIGELSGLGLITLYLSDIWIYVLYLNKDLLLLYTTGIDYIIPRKYNSANYCPPFNQTQNNTMRVRCLYSLYSIGILNKRKIYKYNIV